MYIYIYIFYIVYNGYKKINTNISMTDKILNEINNFMMYPKNLVNYKRDIIITKKEKKVCEKKRVVKYNKNFFVPGHVDKLFWIFYILKYGFEKYELMGNNIFEEEKKLKIEFIQDIKIKTKLLKDTYKFKRIDVCESELLNDEKISFKTFHALCMIHLINILYINDRTYCKLSLYLEDSDDLDNYSIIHKIGEDYVYEYMPRPEILNNYIENKYEITNYEKPIKSVGSYKLPELKEIAINMKLPSTVQNMKKNDIYEKICEFLRIEK